MESTSGASPSTSCAPTADSAPFYWTAEIAASFPSAFVDFLKANDIHPDNYKIHDVPRYVRISSQAVNAKGGAGDGRALDVAELERQLGVSVHAVGWLDGYFKVPAHVKIAGTDAYRTGQLYGIDVSSGAAVAALAVRPGEDVLDLCCAPGAKLCAIAEAMELTGTLTGVDVSAERLASCRTLCEKYGIRNARLVLHDGCSFDAPPPRRRTRPASTVALAGATSGDAPAEKHGGASRHEQKEGEHAAQLSRKRRRQERGGRSVFHLGADLADDDAEEEEEGGVIATRDQPSEGGGTDEAMHPPPQARTHYDKVLVDAECTHDGSIKHLAKFAQWGWSTFERRFLDADRLTALATLQLGLLRSGFRALRPGGSLVYSTCSFAKAQNEEIVAALLREEPGRARLAPIPGLTGAPCRPGALPHTLRFEPRLSGTSGLFIARITKDETCR